MISRIWIPSCQAQAIRSRRFGPIPSTVSRSVGLFPITPSTSAPKRPTNFFARTGPTPFTKPPARYLSIPSLVLGGRALNWRPCSLSRTHQPSAVSHSPALTDGNEPRTVTSSRCPWTFTRRTANPLSSLKKVTLSTSPTISSDGVRAWGAEALILMEVYRDNLSGSLFLALRLLPFCNRLSKTYPVQIGTRVLSAVQAFMEQAEQIGSCLVFTRKTVGNSTRPAEGLHEPGKAVLQPRAAHPDLFGKRPAGLNRLEKHSCQRVSGRNARIGSFRRKDHSTVCIDSQRYRSTGPALALLANRGTAENMVELHHSTHGIVVAAQGTQNLFLQADRRDGRLGGKDRFDQIQLVSRLCPLHARDHRIGIGQLPKLHALLAGNSSADHDHSADALGQRPGLLLGDEPRVKAGPDGAEDGRGYASSLRMAQRSEQLPVLPFQLRFGHKQIGRA